LTGYAQGATVRTVTIESPNRGYGTGRRRRMAPIITIVLMVGIMTALGVAAALWGVDSRPSYRDDHAR